jgi:bifunctional non-homologous end joining protein LigD
LLIKKPDAWADPKGEKSLGEESVLSGLTVEELGEGSEKSLRILETLNRNHAPKGIPELENIQLMLAQKEEQPFNDEDWIFELKYDGFRLLASRRKDRIRLRYRSGRDATLCYPEITRALAALPFEEFTLDGEVVVLDRSGKPTFQLLQRRSQRTQPLEAHQASIELPATLFAFDILSFEDFDLRPLPLVQRKSLLELMLPRLGPVRYSEHFEAQGIQLHAQVVKLGLEGIVGKRGSSTYRGGRQADWRKIPALLTRDFVIVGFTAPKGSRGGFGALHLAGFDRQGILTYAGRVGTGFTNQDLDQIMRIVSPLVEDGSPPPGSPEGSEHTWVSPKTVCEVRFKEATAKGQLRQPAFVRLRPDMAPTDCLLPWELSNETNSSPAQERDKVRPTNPQKVLWPRDGITKSELVDYYRFISPWILPYLRDRLLVMDRYPDGIDGKSFFQKNVPEHVPDWIRTEQLWSEDPTRGNNYLVCDNLNTLLFVANLASIPLHIWGSRVATIEQPDWCILDLDPTEAPFESVVRVAKEIRLVCKRAGLPTFPKTSGSKGLHVLIPMGRRYTFEQTRLLAEVVARIVSMRLPDTASAERRIEDRRGKVYVDYVQNGYGKLLVAPYSVRPIDRAPVSTPLHWDEVSPHLDPSCFTIRTLPQRWESLKEEPLLHVLEHGIQLEEALVSLQQELDGS